MASKPKDLTGQKFGRLIAISQTNEREGTGNVVWLCLCDCGNYKKVPANRLKTTRVSGTKSCGCLSLESLAVKRAHSIIVNEGTRLNLVGKQSGRLKCIGYLGRIHPNSKEYFWECVCQCGRVVPVSAGALSSGRTKSCGCSHKENSGEKNNLWRGGRTKMKYPPEWTKKLRSEIRLRDSCRCQYPNCNNSKNSNGTALHVHHINGDKKNCKSYNLISLCNEHHFLVEVSPELWEFYFYAITSDYG